MTQQVGRIVDLECHQPPPNLICGRCIELERKILILEREALIFKGVLHMKDEQLKARDGLLLEYIEGYTSRTRSMETSFIDRVCRIIGYKDITD